MNARPVSNEALAVRIDAIAIEQKRLDRIFESTVDDIKALIKSEIADLKGEQISDLRGQINALGQQVAAQNLHISDLRSRQEKWDSGAGVVSWLIKTAIAGAGLAAGYFGAKHVG